MKPFLLLNRVDIIETPAEDACRRAEALRIYRKQFRYEQLLHEELAASRCLRQAMREPLPTRASRWRRTR